MIKYALKCACAYEFDAWFQSAAGYDTLDRAGQVSCPSCGGRDVAKKIMAPAVATHNSASEPAESALQAPPAKAAEKHDLPTGPEQQLSHLIQQLHEVLQQHSEYAGRDFANEARRIHNGEAPERLIHGEADLEEARQLTDEGISILPLPFLRKRTAH